MRSKSVWWITNPVWCPLFYPLNFLFKNFNLTYHYNCFHCQTGWKTGIMTYRDAFAATKLPCNFVLRSARPFSVVQLSLNRSLGCNFNESVLHLVNQATTLGCCNVVYIYLSITITKTADHNKRITWEYFILLNSLIFFKICCFHWTLVSHSNPCLFIDVLFIPQCLSSLIFRGESLV